MGIHQLRKPMVNIFKRDYEHYDGVPRINIYVMRLFFGLMVFYIMPWSWKHIITHAGPWSPTDAVAWCTWATYSTLAIIGLYRTLKMLPIMIFMVFYKILWLIFVAYPLWRTDQLVGSPAEELTGMFILLPIPALFIPWGYVFRKYVLPE